jgi:hypothetical protein
MAFGHPSQQDHMMSGIRRAISSPRTPVHLKPHLQKRLGGGASTMQSLGVGRIPGLGAEANTAGGRTANTPPKKGVPHLGAISTPRPKGVPSSAPIRAPRPGAPGPSSLNLPKPRGVPGPSTVLNIKGSSADKGTAGPDPQTLKAPGDPGNLTWDMNKMVPSFDNVPRSTTKPAYQRTRKLANKKYGFGKSKNMNSAPNAMFGEY